MQLLSRIPTTDHNDSNAIVSYMWNMQMKVEFVISFVSKTDHKIASFILRAYIFRLGIVLKNPSCNNYIHRIVDNKCITSLAIPQFN